MGPMPLRTASSPHLGSGGTLLNVPGPPSGPPDAQALHHPLLSCHPLSVGPQRALPAGGPQPGARRHAWGHLPPTLPRALTAEVRAPPVLRLPPRVGTLAGVLGEGVAEAAGEVDQAAVAEVMPAGLQVAAGVHQAGTARERLAAQHLLADALGQSPEPSLSRVWSVPGSAPGLWEQEPLPVHSGPYRVALAGPSVLGDRVLTLLHGAVHLLQVPKLGGGQFDICRKHKDPPHPSLRALWPCLSPLPTLPG